eukprot:57681-Amphidinium_carterae.1
MPMACNEGRATGSVSTLWFLALCFSSRTSLRFAGKVALVKRGSANGEFAPYALKAHHLARAGAEALLIMNNQDHLPARRIGTGGAHVQVVASHQCTLRSCCGGLWNELQISVRACSCGCLPYYGRFAPWRHKLLHVFSVARAARL